jgi:hypothetical protein
MSADRRRLGRTLLFVVDFACKAVAVLEEELAELVVVDEPAGAAEFVPQVAAAGSPVFADWFGLAFFNRAGCEPGLALGDVCPGEGRGFLPLPVVCDRLERSWSRRQSVRDLVP